MAVAIDYGVPGIGPDHGLIFDIQRFSTHDGPGIRTTVFFKGCPLRCLWCHNPESQSIHPEIMFAPDKCIGCGRCFKACPEGAIRPDVPGRIMREKCTGCGRCAEACVSGALSLAGRFYTIDEVVREVEKDSVFYKTSGGGVTVSGGEPLVQYEFVTGLLKACKDRGFHTAVDTCGYVPWKNIEAVLPYTDLFLYDIKQMDPDLHRKITGVGNELILENLVKISRTDIPVLVRVPVIPECTDQQANIEAIAEFLSKLEHKPAVEPLKYHRLGGIKYKKLGRTYACEETLPPGNDRMEAIRAVFERRGIEVVSG